MNIARGESRARGLWRWVARRDSEKVIRRVLRESLTYLNRGALRDLADAARGLDRADIPGSVIECGCALGGSALVLATAKSKARPFYVYDVFGMIPPPSDRDGEDVIRRYATIKSGKSAGIAGNRYCGYEPNLLQKVTDTFARYELPLDDNRIELVQGPFQTTLRVCEPVALAHIDGDWYDSVMVCLERIVPHLSKGGRLVVDDYDHWSGLSHRCRRVLFRTSRRISL